MRTTVVNVKTDEYDEYIGRAMPGYAASEFQNPYRVGIDGTRDECVDLYREHVDRHPELRAKMERLRGKRLGCWCKPHRRCHGDVIVEILEGPPEAPPPPAQGSLF